MQADDKKPRVKRPPTRPPERLPSANVTIEAKLLGTLIYDSQLLPLIRERLTFPKDTPVRPFYREAHQEIYEEICALYDAGAIPEFNTLHDTLESSGRLEAVGGEPGLWQLIRSPLEDSALNISAETRERIMLQWADITRKHALRRAMNDFATGFAGIAYPDAVTAEISPETDIHTLFVKLRKLTENTLVSDLLPIITDAAVEEMPASHGILGDILFEDSLAILYGASGRWKSFVALAWALCIGTGRDWLGRSVTEGDVLYIAAEGGRGVGKRITAWKRLHGITGATRVHVLTVAVQLLDDEQVQRLIRSIRQLVGKPVLIVIDTLSRSMAGGDENAAKDGSRAVAAADAIRAAFPGCAVLLVAHPGKNEQLGVRGWSGYFAAADTVMRISSEETKPRLDIGQTITLSSEKPKDSEPFHDIHLTTVKETWATAEGETVTSLVIVGAEAPGPKLPPMPPSRKHVLQTITEAGAISAIDLERLLCPAPMSRRTLFNGLTALRASDLIAQNESGEYTAIVASATSADAVQLH